MRLQFNGFDWDIGNRPKCEKRNISLSEIERVLSGEVQVIFDLKHSLAEERYIAVGRGSLKKPLFIVFCFRVLDGKRLIRPVSARYMHKKEVEKYEKTTTKI